MSSVTPDTATAGQRVVKRRIYRAQQESVTGVFVPQAVELDTKAYLWENAQASGRMASARRREHSRSGIGALVRCLLSACFGV